MRIRHARGAPPECAPIVAPPACCPSPTSSEARPLIQTPSHSHRCLHTCHLTHMRMSLSTYTLQSPFLVHPHMCTVLIETCTSTTTQYETDGKNPTVDLNIVYNPSADYQVTSPSNDNYKYHVNPCGQVRRFIPSLLSSQVHHRCNACAL